MLCARLLLLAALACAHAAAVYEFPDLFRRIPERTVTPGCAYKGERYAPGQQVETTEPCLNCTCIKAVVVCYLRVCPAPPSPPPRCFMAREVGQCCPSLVCGGDDNANNSVPQLRPTFAPSTTPVIETTESDSIMLVSSAPPDDTYLNDIATNKGCWVNGTLYGDGSAMLSSTYCEYCFCIRGKTNCVKPKCDLVIEGCTPHYDSSFSCCPSRYDCFSKSEFNQVVRAASKTTTTSPAPTTTLPEGCEFGDRIYEQGEVLPDYKACHSCLCSNSTVICDQMKCSPPLEGCQPIIPEGHCCPVSYKCNYNDDPSKYNVKGANSDGVDIVATKTEIKTVKQSDIFKASSSNEEAKPRIEETDFFHNFVSNHRRLDEEIYNRFRPQEDSSNGNQTASPPVSETTSSKTLLTTADSKTETTVVDSIARNSMQNNSEISSLGNDKNVQAVSIGLPETQTISIDSLKNDFFVNNHQTDTESVTEQAQNLQRNNSKQPMSIVEKPNLVTKKVPFHSEENIHNTKEEFNTYPTTFSPNKITQEQTHTESTTLGETETTKNVDSTLIQTTLYFTKDEGISDNSTPYLVTIKDGERTYVPLTTKFRTYTETPSISTIKDNATEDLTPSTLNDFTDHATEDNPTTTVTGIPPTDDLIKKITESESSSTNEKMGTTVASFVSASIKDLATTTEGTKSHVRINSKQPITTYVGKDEKVIEARNPLLEDSLVNLYLPALGREESDDFTNVGSIHLGAPLSVDEIRKDPSSLRSKIKESGGVLFMDPKYTDINPSLPTTQYKQSGINPMDSKNPTPIDRADTETVKYDRKKGPRIQDGYNQTDAGQGFKIIPFIAEDAIRGKFGKLNHTFTGHKDTTEGVPDMVSDFCFIKGRIYMNGEMITKQDPCELCRCFYGQELCQLQRCPTPPPDCTPEKLPNFCCPRYTCVEQSSSRSPPDEKLIGDFQPKIPDTTTKQDIPSNPTQASSSSVSEENRFGVRFHRKPPITRQRETIPKTTQMINLMRTSTKPIPSTLLTTQSPETTRPSSSKAPDYKPSSSTELPKTPFSDPWGLLRVSGCNIYGKFFNINDQVEILSGPCSHCICTATGVECNDIC